MTKKYAHGAISGHDQIFKFNLYSLTQTRFLLFKLFSKNNAVAEKRNEIPIR